MSPLSLRAMSRGARRRSVVASLLIAPLALTALPGAAQAAVRSFRVESSFGCGGVGNVTANRWTVPAGVTSATMVVQGERGGSNGGLGAEITTTITVTPGETFYFCEGMGGGNGASGASGQGGDGGGYTSVSRNSDNSAPLVVAAGGGGKGSGPGGGNGGDAGTANTESNPGVAVGTAGGGYRPDDNGPGRGGINSANSAANGGAGIVWIGGNGGAVSGGNGGGGGGAGIYGGGGGAGSTSSTTGAGGGAGGFSQCLVGGCTSENVAANPYVSFSWDEPIGTSTTISFNGTTRAVSGKPVTLRAVVTPTPTTGTVNFTVDAANQWGCEAVPVDANGVAECRTSVPGERGRHTVRAVYSDPTDAYVGSSHEVEFQVYGGEPSISPSPEVLFGEVELGKSTTRTITVTNVGDADMTLSETYGVYIAEYFPRARPPRSTEFTALDDQCAGRVIAPGASCTVVVRFAPSALGERTAEIEIGSDSWNGPDPVVLIGTGVEARPEERQPEQREPETREPETPSNPAPTPTPEAPAPAPVKPVETPRTPATPPAVGASSPLSPGRPAVVTQAGGVRLPLVCPPGQACSVSGTLTLAITGGQARAAATTKTRVLVRFNGVKIAAGTTKTLSLKLPASFVKAQQRKGVRKLRTTLTVRTTLGNGRRATRRQTVTLLIPRARTAQRAAPRPAQRPSFTG